MGLGFVLCSGKKMGLPATRWSFVAASEWGGGEGAGLFFKVEEPEMGLGFVVGGEDGSFGATVELRRRRRSRGGDGAGGFVIGVFVWEGRVRLQTL